MTQAIRAILILCILLLSGINWSYNAYASQIKLEKKSNKPAWQKIIGDRVSLSLPSSYFGGNPGTDLDEIEAKLRDLDPDYPKRIAAIEQNPDAIALLAFDTQIDNSIISNVNVTSQEVGEEVTIKEYLNRVSRQLSSVYEVENHEIVTINQDRVGRILATVEVEGRQIKQLIYLLKRDTFWTVTYSTTSEMFEQKLPDFEKSIKTFKLKSLTSAI